MSSALAASDSDGAGRRRLVALAAMLATVELATLWQAPWLAQFRHTTVGHLLLGRVFSWRNLAAYGVGVPPGVAVDRLLLRASSA